MNDEWKKKLRNKMDGYETDAPEGLLDDVMSAMAHEHKDNKQGKRRATIIIIGLLSAAALAMLFINIIPQNLNNNKNQSYISKSANTNGKEHMNVTHLHATNNTYNTMAYNASNIHTQEKPLYTSHPKETRQRNHWKQVHSEKNTHNNICHGKLETKESIHDDEPQTYLSNNQTQSKNDTLKKDLSHFDEKKLLLAKSTNEEKRQQISIGATVSGNILSSTNNSSNNIMLADAAPYEEPTILTEKAVNTMGLNEIKTSVHHYQPMRFGITLTYPLNNKWSIESGIVYSHHYSVITKSIAFQSEDIDQYLNYLGIPLNIRYNIWQINKCMIYMSCGGTVEKMIYGKQTSNYDDNTSSQSKRVRIRPLQWSTNLRCGIEYKINKLIGAYFEPGVGYYLNNGSSVQTIYKDHPWNAELKFGLRFFIKEK